MTDCFRISIREFEKSDTDAVRRLIHNTIDISYSPVYPPGAVKFFKVFHSSERIADRSQNGKTLVIEADGNIVGTGSLSGGEISGVFIDPAFQRSGYGRILMLELEKMARANNRPSVSLAVSLPSRRFYEKLGYEITERCSIEVGNGEHLDYWEAVKNLEKLS
jgi:ribosomal protein S18 acetylase RimI-like enzyme